MRTPTMLERYLRPLLAGDRVACRTFVTEYLASADDTTQVYFDLLWPAMEHVDKLYRGDRINTAVENMATRINRAVADQAALQLQPEERNGRKMLICCADGEPEELGAQMCADLFEARGWEVYHLGGGVPNDEILHLTGQLRPDVLLIFGTQPSGVPGVRRLIDLIREVGATPTMNIIVSGGVFNRAEGLWREVNADLLARTAREALPLAERAEARQPAPTSTAPPKKRRRRRRPPLLVEAESQA